MMKRTLRFALTPFMLIARLMLGLAAFISSIASAVIGLAVGLFAVLSVIEFAIGYWQNGRQKKDLYQDPRHRLYGARAAGQSDWTSGGCELSSEQNGSHPWIL